MQEPSIYRITLNKYVLKDGLEENTCSNVCHCAMNLLLFLLLTQSDSIRLFMLAKRSPSQSLRKRTHQTLIDARAGLNTYQQDRYPWSLDFIPLNPKETFEQFKQVTVWTFCITLPSSISYQSCQQFHSISIILSLDAHGPFAHAYCSQ